MCELCIKKRINKTVNVTIPGPAVNYMASLGTKTLGKVSENDFLSCFTCFIGKKQTNPSYIQKF